MRSALYVFAALISATRSPHTWHLSKNRKQDEEVGSAGDCIERTVVTFLPKASPAVCTVGDAPKHLIEFTVVGRGRERELNARLSMIEETERNYPDLNSDDWCFLHLKACVESFCSRNFRCRFLRITWLKLCWFTWLCSVSIAQDRGQICLALRSVVQTFLLSSFFFKHPLCRYSGKTRMGWMRREWIRSRKSWIDFPTHTEPSLMVPLISYPFFISPLSCG